MNDLRARLRAAEELDPAGYRAKVKEARQRAFVPTPEQQAVLDSTARFRVLKAGRRFGKTMVGARAALRAVRLPETRVVWWVANEYKNVRRGYREVLRQTPRGLLAKAPPPPTANDLILHFKDGTRMEFYSGKNPDAMAGEGVDFVVVDEAALIVESVWTQLIRPTLADRRGRAILISTPRGRNWFERFYRRGQDPTDPEVDSWKYTLYQNPHIEDSEADEMRKDLPAKIFRQEVLAEAMANADAIFDMERARTVDRLVPGQGQVMLGIDLAKQNDFTVLSASDAARRPCYHDRLNSVSWTEQKQVIRDAVEAIEGRPEVDAVTLIVDSTGLGDVVFDDLEAEGYDIIPIKFSNEWKAKSVKLLAADLETGAAVLYAPTTEEFEAYSYEITETGRYRFSAPEGEHDDEVSAKLLENWGQVHESLGDVDLGVQEEALRGPESRSEGLEDQEAAPIAPDSLQALLARDEVWA